MLMCHLCVASMAPELLTSWMELVIGFDCNKFNKSKDKVLNFLVSLKMRIGSYFKRESVFNPNNKTIMTHVRTKAMIYFDD